MCRITSNTLPLGGSEFKNNECKCITDLKHAFLAFTVKGKAVPLQA